MSRVFRSGWIPTPASVSRVRLESALKPYAVTIPKTVDHFNKVYHIGMMLNDQWGDCTVAANGHIIQGLTKYGQGVEAIVSDDVVLKAYEAAGFKPNAGPPGENPTDQGWTVNDALAYLRKTGMAGHKISFYGQVEVSDLPRIRQSCAQFGYLSIGVNLPNIAMQQFDDGPAEGHSHPVWDVVPDDGGIDGGHCVAVCGYNSTGPLAWTWGAVVQMTWNWWNTYVEEAWGVVSTDWVNAHTLVDPSGVDKAALGQEVQAVFGVNPFAA